MTVSKDGIESLIGRMSLAEKLGQLTMTAAGYAVTLPGLGRPTASPKGTLPQVPETDLRYDLCGVEASWRAPAASPEAAGKTGPI